MGWAYLLVAGMLEIVWATALTFAKGFTRFWPSAMGIAAAVASFWVLMHPYHHSLHAPWATRVRRVLPGTDLSPLVAAMCLRSIAQIS